MAVAKSPAMSIMRQHATHAMLHISSDSPCCIFIRPNAMSIVIRPFHLTNTVAHATVRHY